MKYPPGRWVKPGPMDGPSCRVRGTRICEPASPPTSAMSTTAPATVFAAKPNVHPRLTAVLTSRPTSRFLSGPNPADGSPRRAQRYNAPVRCGLGADQYGNTDMMVHVTSDRVALPCRCWNTTTAELQKYLGSAIGSLDISQLRSFVQAWHEVEQDYGSEREVEAHAALAAILQGILQTGAQSTNRERRDHTRYPKAGCGNQLSHTGTEIR